MAKGAGEAGENPLVPNAKLRQMYTMMLEARTLEKALEKRATAKGKRRGATIRGQEAVRVSTAIDLGADDLVSDGAVTGGMGLILGGDAGSLLRGLSRAKDMQEKALRDAGATRLLRVSSDAEERLRLAVGAALALKAQGRRGVVVVYAGKGEVSPAAWRRILGPAGELDLPVIFVVLPRTGAPKKGDETAELCGVARKVGVPGMPVDACDAVALYRVVQESLGRTRNGDGAVLIESIVWRPEGRRSGVDDPLEHLEESLLARRICTPAWFRQARKAADRRLRARPRESKK
ncbi:thiamine pyrophosphate-dependent enzyme [Edaphobacter aggregans]|uniref:thiamine pyrophosphate-dependent enzyme n=1 Tax=Edaphobacter aggregans TaxID=570835 RepID=UPI0006897183|nr:thiamine pyrophosphate-dependent enzyme [Edaphobacter aggregans]